MTEIIKNLHFFEKYLHNSKFRLIFTTSNKIKMKTQILKVKCCKETIYGLTFGKIYDVIEEDFMCFKVVNDSGKAVRIAKYNFWNA